MTGVRPARIICMVPLQTSECQHRTNLDQDRFVSSETTGSNVSKSFPLTSGSMTWRIK